MRSTCTPSLPRTLAPVYDRKLAHRPLQQVTNPQRLRAQPDRVRGDDEGREMRNDPTPGALLAACLGFPLHELRRAVPRADPSNCQGLAK